MPVPANVLGANGQELHKFQDKLFMKCRCMREGADTVGRAAVHGRWDTGEASAVHKRLLVDQVLDLILRDAGGDAKMHILSLTSSMKVRFVMSIECRSV